VRSAIALRSMVFTTLIVLLWLSPLLRLGRVGLLCRRRATFLMLTVVVVVAWLTVVQGLRTRLALVCRSIRHLAIRLVIFRCFRVVVRSDVLLLLGVARARERVS
jgi:hypothetical protein